MRILLLRHGATDWNLQGRCQGATDLDLNEVGIRQAEAIAARLSLEKIDAIYSSRLKRAQQTAERVSLHHSLPVMIEEEFRELNHGELEGMTFNEIRENYGDFMKRWRTEPAEIQLPGGERLADVAQRAWEVLKRIARRHEPAETVVVVSHNFPILGIVCRITGTHLNQYRTFHLDPGGVIRLNHGGGENWGVTQINDKDYASESAAPRA